MKENSKMSSMAQVKLYSYIGSPMIPDHLILTYTLWTYCSSEQQRGTSFTSSKPLREYANFDLVLVEDQRRQD